MKIDKKTAFQQSRLTHRLEMLIDESIRANDPFFIQKTGCSIRELRVLRMVDEYPSIAFNEIMSITGLERSLVSRLIRSLIDKKLIFRVNSEEDARRYGLFTTESGKACRLAAKTLTDSAEALLLNPLNPDQIKMLNQSISQLATWVRSKEYKTQVAELFTLT